MKLRTLVGMFAAAASVAACGSSDDAQTADGPKEVEIFSWWTSGGESQALDAMLGTFSAKYPDTKVINSAVTGGAGTSARETLTNRLHSGNPPDAFQAHGGAELTNSWIKVNGDDMQSVMEPLDFLYDQQGWRTAYPQDVLDIATYKGQIYSVLINIHRGNVMYFNTKIFTDNALTPPTTWEQFYTVADALKAKNIPALALGAKDVWAASMIFENLILAKGGADYYRDFFAGKKSPNDMQVQQAAAEMVKIFGYLEPNAGMYGWDGACDLLIADQAAMTLMGDWAKGYMQSKNFKPNDAHGFGQFAVPGTDTSFVVVTDTFGLPKGAPHRENALKLLSVFGSQEAQDAFNPLKGSIPPRTDANKEKYDEMAQLTIADFAANTHVASMAHGSAAPPDFVTDFSKAMTDFIAAPDANVLVAALNTFYSRLQ